MRPDSRIRVVDARSPPIGEYPADPLNSGAIFPGGQIVNHCAVILTEAHTNRGFGKERGSPAPELIEVCAIAVLQAADVTRIGIIMTDNVDDGGAQRYQRQWQAYRTRRNLIAFVLVVEFLLFLPFVALVIGLERHLFSTDKSFFPAALLWGALYIFTVSRLRTYPCPRCGRNFFGGFFATPETVLGRNCVNCGLRKYGEE